MTSKPQSKTLRSNNSDGKNQYGSKRLIIDFPLLPALIQGYLDANVRQKDLPETFFDEHNIQISLRAVQRLTKDYGLKTVRRNGLSPSEQGFHILKTAEEDPLGRWGGRLIKEKLAAQGIHIPRDEIMAFRQLENPEATAARHPATRKVHHHGLHSSGPNEEWCIDGHEKILNSMGIAVYGINDKFSRMELGLWAVPNARLADVPPALYLRLVLQRGGMPVTTTSDKGSELGKLIPLVTTMRYKFQPYLSEDVLPSFKAVKSVYNITRERNWRPLWEKDLGNILYIYNLGKPKIGFRSGDPLHKGVSLWLWARIVQIRLDQLLLASQTHRIRKQPKSLLPTGGRRIDFYTKPQNWNGENQLIEVPKEETQKYLRDYGRPDLLRFGSSEMVADCEKRFVEIGSPELSAQVGWLIFAQMLGLPFPTDWNFEERAPVYENHED